jgi:hypothetical protein
MFKCQKCSKSDARPHRIVTERKMVQHTPVQAGPRGGHGSQIVAEMNLCSSCAGVTPEVPVPAPVEFTPPKEDAAGEQADAS